MKVKLIQPSEVTTEELDDFKQRIAVINLPFIIASDVGMDKRIIAINFDENKLILVNPVIKMKSEAMVVYAEVDTVKPKRIRRTLRHVQFIVSTDNLGDVEFRADNTKWDSLNELMGDSGLFEAVMVQRMIDAIDGIDVTSPIRRYTPTLETVNKNRNERVMLQSPAGETLFLKRKKAKSYLDKGYKIL